MESQLPYHRLRAYVAATQLVDAVANAKIRERSLRVQATRAADSVVLNIAEGAGRALPGERRHAFTIARGEALEAVVAVEIAVRGGRASAAAWPAVVKAGNAVYALLTGLIRKYASEASG